MTTFFLLCSGGGMDKRKYSELQVKYDELKEEQTQLYRSQSAHIQRLLDLNEQLKAKDQSMAALKSDVEQSHFHHESLQSTIDCMKETVDEKNMNIQIMQDELTALQLELLQTDDKLARLEEENKRLVDKWMSKVSETANLLNEQIEGAGIALESGSGGPSSHCPSTVSLSFVQQMNMCDI
jgi:autophagy-related protein 16